ncbi:MAG: hypothetical protein N3E45_03150 [Oscillatoriaceae bacterium SKW80]|nr:hypothetical protein [Oscillatoriaceae bacterium SKYG93]MCX8119819.1 hypothetical protein [Oscillatoriaceae bacterium SKW80]MDW8452077.1 hypothetical protein [Oscillatoriaceae cyanobacterium SKYGB_i_bin93]
MLATIILALAAIQSFSEAAALGKNLNRIKFEQAEAQIEAIKPGRNIAWRQEVEALLEEAEKLVRNGEVKRALAVYNEARVISENSLMEVSASAWNTLCWFGSLWGHALEVMDACNRAVAGDPESEEFRDSRGLARALVGDINGAIEDFQAFVDATDDEERKYQRQNWINILRAGDNPFTPEVIRQLFRE